MTSNIFNNPSPVVEEDIQLDEKVSLDKFVKGGNDKITQSEVDSLLGKKRWKPHVIPDLVKNKSYRDGKSNPKAKNPNKKDTIDFHLFQMGQQVMAEEISNALLDEKVSADKFVKGGNDKITQSEVDSLLGKIYDNSKLTKDLIKNKSYRDGESNSKAKNSNKKDTIDFHLFQLGQQVELSRQ
jgi:parvulin-like peptidyl-prolyl isomerase